MNFWKMSTFVLLGVVGYFTGRIIKYKIAVEEAKDALEKSNEATKAAMDAAETMMKEAVEMANANDPMRRFVKQSEKVIEICKE